MKVAVIGTGIAGNVAAYHLCKEHEVTVFEANDYVGGHTHTHTIEHGGKSYRIDTGFIVFNYKTYPNFTRLLDELGVEVQPSNMSFSVKCERTGLEYNGTTLNSLFAQRSNLLKPSFYRMITDILRFNREAPRDLISDRAEITLGSYLTEKGYSRQFIEHYLVPMGAAIWSTDPERMFSFPARFLVRFMANHGMLSVDDRPQWYVIKNGSNSYVDRLIAPFADRIRLNTPVESITRHADHVSVTPVGGAPERFDAIFIAAHSDQALKMLSDASDAERLIVSRGDTCYVMMNRYPYSNGHLMVSPYRHLADPADLEGPEIQELHRLMVLSQAVLRITCSAQGFNVGWNFGQAAGAGITAHIHMHIVPRWAGDSNFMPILADTRIIPQHIEKTYTLLAEAFS